MYRRAAFLETVGELAAGFFLQRGVDPAVQYRCACGGPDFRSEIHGRIIEWEAKTAVGGMHPGEPLSFGPVPPRVPKVRHLLEAARKQFTAGDCGAVLLVSWYRPPVSLNDVVSAMYGRRAIHIPMLGRLAGEGAAQCGEFVRLRDGKCTTNRMTRIAAVGLVQVRGLGAELRGVFVHNAFAVRPIPAEVLDPCVQWEPTEDRRCLRLRNQDDHNCMPAGT